MLDTHANAVLNNNLLSMTEKLRLELAIRLQQVQTRITRALANVGVASDFEVSVSGNADVTSDFEVSSLTNVRMAGDLG